jgi:hypothetical protein
MFTFSCPKCALFLDPNEYFLVEMICHSAQTWNTTTQSRLFLSSVLFYVFDFAFSLSNLHITTLVCKLSYSSKRKMSVFHFLVCSDNNLIVSICVCIFFLFRRFNKIQQHSKLWNVSIMKCGLDLRRCILIFGICCYFIPRRCISFKVLT